MIDRTQADLIKLAGHIGVLQAEMLILREELRMLQAEMVTARVLAQRISDPHHRIRSRDEWVEQDA